MFGRPLIGCNGGDGTPAPIDLTQGLVAHYLLNNNADDSYGIYEGTPSGGVDFQGDIAKFDGVDDYINTLYYFNTSISGAISAWVYTTAIPASNTYVVGSYDIDPNRVYIQMAATGKIAYGVGSLYKETTTNMPLNTFVNITIKFDGSTMYAYLNSVLIDTSSYTGFGESLVPSFIGARNMNGSATDGYFSGYISNVRFYTQLPNQEFIDTLYAEGYYPKPLTAPTTTGLIAHYPLTGTAEDTTGNYNGTENGGLTYVDDAEFGSVANFDGVDDYIDVGAIFPIGDFTFLCWLDTTLLSGDNMNIFGCGTTTGDSYYFYPTTTYGTALNQLRLYGIGAEILIGSDIRNTGFRHIALKRSGDSFTLYVDNILDATGTQAGINSAITSLGNNPISLDRPLNGLLSNVRIYNRPLTIQEHTDIYNYEKNFRPIDIDDGLVAYYPLANNSLDNYKNQYDGTDAGGVTYDGVSASFDGVDDTIDLNIGTTQDLYGLSMWVYNAVDVDGNGTLEMLGTPNQISITSYMCFNNVSGNLTGETFTVLDYISSNPTTSSNFAITDTITAGWHHYFIRWNGTKYEIYIDGVLGTMIYYGNNYLIKCDPYFGTRLTGDYRFTGKLSKVRPYGKTISLEQIKVIYNTEKGDFGL